MSFLLRGHSWFCVFALLLCLRAPLANAGATVNLAGAKVELPDYDGPATWSVHSPEKFRLEIEVSPNSEKEPLTLHVTLAATGRETWPYNDVEVRDSDGKAIPVRRPGIDWHKLHLTVPARPATYVVKALEPTGERPNVLPEEKRQTTDSHTGLKAAICKWHDGRQAALSIRFDDSHRTHLSKAIPILREYGFRGTFMVNPGKYPPGTRRRSAFDDHRAEWEAVARRGDQEFANHTSHHRGAENDQDMEREIAEACETIWELFPHKSRLIALNLGGGTSWTTTRPLTYYLDKYHLFDASSGSLGMDDVYGGRVPAFEHHLKRHIERGGWCRIHYHSIGDGQAASETNFRAALDAAKEHEPQLWIAGIADIHKYQTERAGATLAIENATATRAEITLTCSTDSSLYDQPLTLLTVLPVSWPTDRVTVTDSNSQSLPLQSESTDEGSIVRFHVPPITATYVIAR